MGKIREWASCLENLHTLQPNQRSISYHCYEPDIYNRISDKILFLKKKIFFIGLSSKQLLWLLLSFNNNYLTFKQAHFFYYLPYKTCSTWESLWTTPLVLSALIDDRCELVRTCAGENVCNDSKLFTLELTTVHICDHLCDSTYSWAQ